MLCPSLVSFSFERLNPVIRPPAVVFLAFSRSKNVASIASCLVTQIQPHGLSDKPIFGGFRIGLSKRVFERGGSAFYLSVDTFDGGSIVDGFVA